MKQTGAGCAVPVAGFAKISPIDPCYQAVAGDLTTGKIVSAEHYGPAHDFYSNRHSLCKRDSGPLRRAWHKPHFGAFGVSSREKNYIAAPDRYQAFPKNHR